MPLGLKPACFKCDTNVSEIWQKTIEGNTVCNDCFLGKMTVLVKTETAPVEKAPSPEMKFQEEDVFVETIEVDDSIADEPADDVKPRNEFGPGTRSGNTTLNVRGGRTGTKKTRGRSKKLGTATKATVGKGRGRRAVFKKQLPSKAPTVVSTSFTSGHLFHHDIYYQVGDIVSVTDEDDGVYYAQIRGLLQDQFCEKSAVLTWLIPTQSSPPPDHGFDPLTYILGPEEELPRKLDYLDFVMHAPNEYYKLDENIRVSSEKDAGYIWTSMGAVRRTIHS
ncbi:hypothetical protein GHT06_015469 [Daphnia sinensis]|uniref:GATA zinc finger domain-containing protein 1 n=1 Tax=Daphnia sinensis TaxID=1820382 RepID=A0AAD5LB60_9CRUS|nr:hypothetical protein GHT06_015469 [Daphnia sinensis]